MKTLVPDQSAFSLIELMIILAVIGIMAALTGPNLLELIPSLQLNNAGQRIITDLHFARFRSISTGKEYKVNFNVSAESYQIQEGNLASGSTWPGTSVDHERRFNDSSNPYYQKGIDLYSVNQNPIFTPKGFSSTDTIIKIQNNRGHKKSIKINPTGRIKICDGWN